MIEEFREHWEDGKSEIREKYEESHPSSYTEIVADVVTAIAKRVDYFPPNPEKIYQIDDGDYQGTLVFVIPEDRYQPRDYYYVRVAYGSCSGCDTLLSIRRSFHDEEAPDEDQTDAYMRLALHVFQSLKKMDPESYV